MARGVELRNEHRLALNVAKTQNNTVLPNGNVMMHREVRMSRAQDAQERLPDLGTYIKSDGTTATLGDTAQLGDVDLRENTFYSSFTDTIPLTPEAQTLPAMRGSGQVRELRAAA